MPATPRTPAPDADPAYASRWYGPRVIGTSSLLVALTAPGQTPVISAFVDPIIGDIGVSRSAVSTAYMAGTLIGACALPFIGRWIDRYGARRIAALIGLGFGAVLMAAAAVTELAGLTVAFVGLRMLGQGALSLAGTTAVAVYIERRRGTAQGITAAVGAAGISLSPVLLESLVAEHGFRTVWFAEGLVVWALVIPLALFGLPRRPQAMAPARAGASTGRDAVPQVAWTRGQAMRTSMFWVIALGVGVVALLATGLAFHQFSLLGERGLTPVQAAANFVPQTIAGLAATFVTGWLADRLSDRVLIIGSLLVLTAALAAAGFVAPGWSAIAYGMAIGVAGNSFRTIEATAFPHCFGLAHIGAIRGVVHTITVAGSAFGPVLFSLGRDWAGSYRPMLLALTVMPLATIVFAVFAKTPPALPPGRATEPGPGSSPATGA